MLLQQLGLSEPARSNGNGETLERGCATVNRRRRARDAAVHAAPRASDPKLLGSGSGRRQLAGVAGVAYCG